MNQKSKRSFPDWMTPDEKEAAINQDLRALCRAFIDKQQIHCAETIYQTDGVIENAYEFIEGIADLVGYFDDGDTDDEEDD